MLIRNNVDNVLLKDGWAFDVETGMFFYSMDFLNDKKYTRTEILEIQNPIINKNVDDINKLSDEKINNQKQIREIKQTRPSGKYNSQIKMAVFSIAALSLVAGPLIVFKEIMPLPFVLGLASLGLCINESGKLIEAKKIEKINESKLRFKKMQKDLLEEKEKTKDLENENSMKKNNAEEILLIQSLLNQKYEEIEDKLADSFKEKVKERFEEKARTKTLRREA